MSISDKLASAAETPKGAECLKNAKTCLRWAVFCALFAAIYENFSHGVYSLSMILMFVYPLAAAILFLLIFLIRPLRHPSPWPAKLFGAGIAALTVGSCFRGIVEIYGTTSDLISVYYVAGAILSAAGIAAYIGETVMGKKA